MPKFQTSIKQLPEMSLLYVQADVFPQGIRAAWETLEKDLTDLRGRKYYGWAKCKGNVLVYRACMTLKNDAEPVILKLPVLNIPQGSYVCAKLPDWQSKIPQIGEMFDEMEKKYAHAYDRKRPNLEHYKSKSLLVLMLPILEDVS